MDAKGNFVANNCPQFPCPDSKHTKFHMSDKRIRIVFGGNRSSKSYSGLMELLMMACFKKHPMTGKQNPTAGRYRLYCPDYAVAEKLYIPMMKEFIPKVAFLGEGKTREDCWKNSYDPRYHLLQLKGGVTIDFMSYDQEANKSESVPLDAVMADEEMPENIYSASLSRLISRDGRFFMTVTPLYGLSWGLQFLESTDPQIEVFTFEIYDNPYISPKAIADFEASVPEHEKEARIRGRFMELQGLVYKEITKDVHMVRHEPPKSHYPVVFALDPHPRKASVMTWAYVTPQDDVVFFDELEMRGTAKEIAHAIRAKEALHKAKTMLRLIDPAARGQGNHIASFETDTLREFEKEGMGFSLADNSEAGYNVVHEYLGYEVTKPLSSMNRPRCFFTTEVTKTFYGMTHLMWDEWAFKKSMRDDKEKIKDYKKDFPDTVRYILASHPTYRNLFNNQPRTIGNMYDWERYQNRLEVRNLMKEMNVLGGRV